METLLAPGHVWMAAAVMSVIALAVAGRTVVGQARRSAGEARDEAVWAQVSAAARQLAAAHGDATASEAAQHRAIQHDVDVEEAEQVVIRALGRSRTRSLALDALTNAARVDFRIARNLRGRTELVSALHRTAKAQLCEKDPARRAAAAELVATLRLRGCRAAIAVATNDPDPGVRVAACRCLATVDPAQAFGVLLRLVDTDGPWAADLLADVARRLEHRGAGDIVADRAAEWAVTPAIVRLLGAPRLSERAGAILRDATQADDGEIRAGAAEALGRDPHPEAVGALVDLLSDEEERVRLQAVRALGGLGALGSRVALIDLSAMLADPSRRVRFAAGSAIASLPGGRAMLAHSMGSSDPLVCEAVAMALWDDTPESVHVRDTVVPMTRPGARRTA